jgi:general stress protein 26
MDEAGFWRKVHQIASKATWAYLATAKGNQPKVRVVHPAFEGDRLWIATGRTSPKAHHIEHNPKVELFYAVGPEMIHLTVTGRAKFVDEILEKKRVWTSKVFDYDLAQFWPGGPEAADFGLLFVEPTKVELTSLAEMTANKKPEVWRAPRKK